MFVIQKTAWKLNAYDKITSIGPQYFSPYCPIIRLNPYRPIEKAVQHPKPTTLINNNSR